jgi:ParB family chromosome partitioning protein
MTEDKLIELPIEKLSRGRYQPRIHFGQEELQSLADSIAQQGVVQPIIARPLPGGVIEIVAGERRWRAAQMAGQQTVLVVLREMSDQQAMICGLTENLQRENLNPIEEALSFQRLIDEFGFTHEECASTVVAGGHGKSRDMVTQSLRLLRLDPAVQQLLSEKKIVPGHVRDLVPLPSSLQREIARLVIENGWSVRQVEGHIRKLGHKKQPAPGGDADVTRLEGKLREVLCQDVYIRYKKSGEGDITIKYRSLEELDNILAHIRGYEPD